MHNCSHPGLSKNWKTCLLASRSVVRLRKGVSDWEVVLLWIFVYTGRRIEDVWFECSGYHCVYSSIIVFCFWTPAYSDTKFCLVTPPCHVFYFYFHLFFFFSSTWQSFSLQSPFTGTTVVNKDCTFRLAGSIWTWSACSKGQVTYSGLLGELAERARDSQGCLPFCLKSDTRLEMEELLGLCS